MTAAPTKVQIVGSSEKPTKPMVAAINNAGALVRPHLWFSGDEPQKYHPSIFHDPAIAKFVRADQVKLNIRDGDVTAEECSNVWAFDRSEGFSLVGIPPSDDRAHGVFATRSPRRPNPIGLTVVELLGREGPVLHVRGIDMLDGTPILDLKPYLSNVPPERLRRGWLAEAEGRTGMKP